MMAKYDKFYLCSQKRLHLAEATEGELPGTILLWLVQIDSALKLRSWLKFKSDTFFIEAFVEFKNVSLCRLILLLDNIRNQYNILQKQYHLKLQK